MRIGVEGSVLANRRGFGRMARLSLEALARTVEGRHELVVLLDRPSASSVFVPSCCERVEVDVSEAPTRAASARTSRKFSDLYAMCRATARARLDVLWFPATYTYFPVWGVERLVVTMHDALPMLHPKLVFPTRRGRVAWALKERLAAWQADLVTTPSAASKRDLIRVYGLDASRVEVVPEAADPVFHTTADDERSRDVLQRVGVPPGTPFLLYVGGLAPHKNLIRLIEAFAATAPAPYLLVLVGDPGDVFHSHVPELHRAVERHGISKRTVFAGFVADSDLTYLYGRTHALVQPSLLEGFGLPPVEAMACSSPVLYSQRGSLPEVVGDAGLAFDPLDVGSIAAAIARITADPELRADLAWRALARSSLFSWDESGRRLLASLESVRAQPQRRTG